MEVVFSHLLIYAVLHEAVSSSECLSSNDVIISETLIGKDLDRSDCHLVYGTMPEFA